MEGIQIQACKYPCRVLRGSLGLSRGGDVVGWPPQTRTPGAAACCCCPLPRPAAAGSQQLLVASSQGEHGGNPQPRCLSDERAPRSDDGRLRVSKHKPAVRTRQPTDPGVYYFFCSFLLCFAPYTRGVMACPREVLPTCSSGRADPIPPLRLQVVASS